MSTIFLDPQVQSLTIIQSHGSTFLLSHLLRSHPYPLQIHLYETDSAPLRLNDVVTSPH
jgi:hypothetical protein